MRGSAATCAGDAVQVGGVSGKRERGQEAAGQPACARQQLQQRLQARAHRQLSAAGPAAPCVRCQHPGSQVRPQQLRLSLAVCPTFPDWPHWQCQPGCLKSNFAGVSQMLSGLP